LSLFLVIPECKGVLPFLSFISTSAPFNKRISTTSLWPVSAAVDGKI
jgi:hypothetical protein